MTDYLSKKAFAESQGWSPSYVTKLRNEGRLVLAPDGKMVDVTATLSMIGKTADPAREGVRQRHQQHRVDRDVYGQMQGGGGDDTSEFHRNRAEKEKHLARVAKAEADKLEEMTVERHDVHAAAYKYGRLLRDNLLGLPRQISADLSAMSDPWQIEQALTERIRQTLNDMARIGAADLRRTMPHVRRRLYRLPRRVFFGPDAGSGLVGRRLG